MPLLLGADSVLTISLLSCVWGLVSPVASLLLCGLKALFLLYCCSTTYSVALRLCCCRACQAASYMEQQQQVLTR